MSESPETDVKKHTQVCRAYHKGKQLSHPENAYGCLICKWYETETRQPPTELYRPHVVSNRDQP